MFRKITLIKELYGSSHYPLSQTTEPFTCHWWHRNILSCSHFNQRQLTAWTTSAQTQSSRWQSHCKGNSKSSLVTPWCHLPPPPLPTPADEAEVTKTAVVRNATNRQHPLLAPRLGHNISRQPWSGQWPYCSCTSLKSATCTVVQLKPVQNGPGSLYILSEQVGPVIIRVMCLPWHRYDVPHRGVLFRRQTGR